MSCPECGHVEHKLSCSRNPAEKWGAIVSIDLGDDPDGDLAGYDGAITPIVYWCPDACGRMLTAADLDRSVGPGWRKWGMVRVDEWPRPGPNLLRIEQATRAERADNPRDE